MKGRRLKHKLFEKEISVYDFTIPEFVEWMATLPDLSEYITRIKVPIDGTFDYANITVIDKDGVAIEGAIVTIDDIKTGNTDNSGQCIIQEIPFNEQHNVTIRMEGYQIFSHYYPAADIISLVITLEPEEQQEESESEEDKFYNVNISVVDENQNPIQGATITISAENMEECNGITNEVGLCAIEIPQEEIYSIKAEAEGYLVNTADYFVSELYGLMTIVLEEEGPQGEV